MPKPTNINVLPMLPACGNELGVGVAAASRVAELEIVYTPFTNAEHSTISEPSLRRVILVSDDLPAAHLKASVATHSFNALNVIVATLPVPLYDSPDLDNEPLI